MKSDVHGREWLLADKEIEHKARTGVMRAIQKLLLFGEAIHGVKSLDQLRQTIWIESAHWLRQVPKCPAVVEIQRLRLIVGEDPRKDRVLLCRAKVGGGKNPVRIREEKIQKCIAI